MQISESSRRDFRVREAGGRKEIFDAWRRRWVRLTPEEWVRQHVLAWLTVDLTYPSAFIAVEKEIRLASLKKRLDILIFDLNHQPWMIIECKAADTTLTEDVLMQVLRYNMAVPVPYLVITNGQTYHAAHRDGQSAKWLEEMPAWNKGVS